MAFYPCLVLDHDDTTVDSTRTVNYPQFLEALAYFRPGFHMSLEEYIQHCFHTGFYVMCEQVLHYTAAELSTHVAMWKEYHRKHHPPFFPGMPEFLQEYRSRGGIVCVVSHSSADVILSAYEAAGVVSPDFILGAEQPPERMKPEPWPLQEIMRRYCLKPRDCLVVDDALLGGKMARAAGVDFACAGWYGMLPEIEACMKQESDFFFSSVAQFSDFIFSE